MIAIKSQKVFLSDTFPTTVVHCYALSCKLGNERRFSASKNNRLQLDLWLLTNWSLVRIQHGPPISPFCIKCLARYRAQRPVPQHDQCRSFAGLSFTHPVCRLDELLQLWRGVVGGDIAVLVAKQ